MRSFLIIAVVMFGLAPVTAQADTLTIDLAQDHVDITTGFTGAHLIVFGVREKAGAVAVVLRGPEKTVKVRRKENVLGTWINRRTMKFRRVPLFYDYAMSEDEARLGHAESLKKNGIGLNALYFDPDIDKDDTEFMSNFQEGLIRNKQAQGLYPLRPKEVQFLNNEFFRVNFYLPSNVPTGHYQILTFLINKGEIIEKKTTNLRVGQVGLGAKVFRFAHKHGLSYGLLCVAIALLAGWTVNVLRRKE